MPPVTIDTCRQKKERQGMSGTITRDDLQNLYESHWARLDGLDEPETNHFVEVAFDCDGDVSEWIQFQWGMMNAAMLKDERMDAWKQIIEDEGLTIHSASDVSITTYDPEVQDSERLVSLTERMLDEIYGRSLNDVVSIGETDL